MSPTLKPTIEPTPTKLPEREEKDFIKSIIDNAMDLFKSIAANSFARALDIPIATTIGAIVLWASLAPFVMNLPMVSPLASISAWFVPLFSKRKKPWGKVYDSETGLGIPLAAVRLFDKEFNKLLKTELTDNKGRFGFLAKPGRYYIQVVKKDYSFPSKIVSRGYRGETVEVKSNEPIIVDIPLDSNVKMLSKRLNILSKFTDVLNYLRIPLLILGTIIALAFVVIYHRTIDIVIIGMYSFVWIWEVYGLMIKSRTYGVTYEFANHQPINMAIVRVFDGNNNKLVYTKVTDTKGRFRFLINKGNYYITALKQGFLKYKSKPMTVSKYKVVAEDIALKSKNQLKKISVDKEESMPTLLDLAQNNA